MIKCNKNKFKKSGKHQVYKNNTLEAEGMVFRAISVILEKEEGMRSLMGRLAK